VSQQPASAADSPSATIDNAKASATGDKVADRLWNLGTGAIGGIIVLLGHFVAERFKRLSRWQAFGERLWCEKMQLYPAVCHAASLVVTAAMEYVNEARMGRDPEATNKAHRLFWDRWDSLTALDAKRETLLGDEFNAVYVQFCRKLNVYVFTARASELTHKDPSPLEELSRLSADLIGAARKDLTAKELSEQVKKAIIETTKKPADRHADFQRT
jgi:hypothetical protein